MCGIAGLVGYRPQALAVATVQTMTDALQRRGPDSAGLASWDGAALGHRRLAIFDLSAAGHQPMTSPDGAIGIVFNGSIYNFRELRAELEGDGCRFRSQTDTEVLIHGYRQWGINRLIAKLRGMFAFALWDDPQARLYLVRDRLGVKPLVYSVRDGTLAFASSVRALRAGGLAEDVDEAAVAEFLEFGFVSDQRSIYRGVAKLPAATVLEWSGGRMRSWSYWSPATPATSTRSFNDIVDETEALFLDAVELRLHADVPVGTLLSGGIDSGLICWAVARLGGNLTAYTVGTPGHPEDESEDAVATARALGVPHQVLQLSPADAPDVSELVSAYAEPFACASALGMLAVSRAVSSSAKVLLTGDGGDDVFLGYPRHRYLASAEQIARRLPPGSGKAWRSVRGLIPQRGPLRRATHFLDYATGGLGAFTSAAPGLPEFKRRGWLGERLTTVPVDQRLIPWSLDSARNVLSEYLEHDRRTQFVAEYMTKVDGATMHHALEARSPFLDTVLWDHASSIPFELRLHQGRLKAVLRELARRHIGERTARGRKRGFHIPADRWIAGRWRAAAEDVFRDSLLQREGWMRAHPILAELDECARRGEGSQRLWYAFVLESWLRHERATEPASVN